MNVQHKAAILIYVRFSLVFAIALRTIIVKW